MKLNFGKTQNQVDWRFNQMNAYQKDLSDIKDTLNSTYDSLEEAKKAIKPLLLKLNNPTFYSTHSNYIHSCCFRRFQLTAEVADFIGAPSDQILQDPPDMAIDMPFDDDNIT